MTAITTAATNPKKESVNGHKIVSQVSNDKTKINETPLFPKWIYDHLPDPFKTGSSLFNDSREKDTFLLSSIVFLSGCLPNYSFVYSGMKYHVNLYSMIIAPAGSGKGKMKWAKNLGIDIIAKIKKENEDAINEFETEIHIYNNLSKKERTGLPPIEPNTKRLIIPANSSSAFFLKALHFNGGNGLMFETEADLLSMMQGNSWSNFTVELRNAFEHEAISSGRIGDIKFEGVESPRLTMLLSGTPNQVAPLVKSVENGLFSRILYYYFNPPPVWKDPFATIQALDENFKPLAHNCYVLWEYLRNKNTELSFSLNGIEQTEKFNDFFTKNLKEYTSLVSKDMSATIYRLGVMTMRIAAILSIFRNFGNLSKSNVITTTAKDLDIAFKIMEVCLKHTVHIYSLMLKNSGERGSQESKFNYFNSLPVIFSKSQALLISKEFGFSERTVNNYLSEMVRNELLVRTDRGIYNKYNK